MEPRSAIGAYDRKTERYTLQAGCQGVMGLRGGLAEAARRRRPTRCAF